ncbi:MAG: 6-phosphogluconolactonase [Myxococcales bacterium]|nr:6-phosphogluconolactonase [Myxococcales bacterium]
MSGAPAIEVTDDLAGVAGPLLIDVIARRVRDAGRCRLALSGGGTPAPTFEWLRDHLPAELYPGLHVTWIDERLLPVDAGDWRSTDWPADTNIRLAMDHWLGDAPAPGKVVPMLSTGHPQPDAAAFAARFAAELQGAIDVSVLGVGPDGHIASLFPGHPALGVRDATCAAVLDSPKPPPTRLTLTLPVLEAAPVTVLLAKGAEKADVLARALAGDDTLPLGRLRPRGDVHWILDPAAAAGLKPGATA